MTAGTAIERLGGRSFRGMGTTWWIRCDRPRLVDDVVPLVQDVEARLSRFRASSALSVLNRERCATDPILAEVVSCAVRMRERTGGAFDPTLGSQLARLGYDRDFRALGHDVQTVSPAGPGRLQVHVDGDRVSLVGDGELDLGGIAKGWTVDRVHDALLARGAHRVLVDGGGDLRGTGSWPVGVGRDRAIALEGGLATSSTLLRTWRVGAHRRHHLVDPRTGQSSASPVVVAAVRAPDATTADALATALVVSPERVVRELPALGASAWMEDRLGCEWTTPDWKELP